jgi:hypothetical protein
MTAGADGQDSDDSVGTCKVGSYSQLQEQIEEKEHKKDAEKYPSQK